MKVTVHVHDGRNTILSQEAGEDQGYGPVARDLARQLSDKLGEYAFDEHTLRVYRRRIAEFASRSRGKKSILEFGVGEFTFVIQRTFDEDDCTH